MGDRLPMHWQALQGQCLPSFSALARGTHAATPRPGGLVPVLRHIALLSTLAVAAACTVTMQPEAGSGIEPTGEVEATRPGEPVEADGAPAKDAGTPKKDAGKKPAPTEPDDLLGELSGSCGIVKTQLTVTSPTLEQNALTFATGETYTKASLSADAQRMFDMPNAGGSSAESEIMSLEVLRACEGAKLLKTETEVGYLQDAAGPATITDMLVEIDGKKIGVSVTRAYRPSNIAFPDADVKSLIEKKLEGILQSTSRVKPEDKWVKQILHVFAATNEQADAVVRVLPTISSAVRADTIVLLTKTTGGGFVYCNPDPPLGNECP
jgi:hypothetical protein